MSKHAAVSLTEEQQKLVERLTRSGRFNGANDVVATGLRLLDEREKAAASFIAELEIEIEKGIASGDAAPMERVEDLLADFRQAQP